MILQSPLSSTDFEIFFILTIIYTVTFCILDGYLALRILEQKRKTNAVKFGFVHSIVVMFLLLIISRLFYMNFDFNLTKFDPNLYYIYPNFWFWKMGSMFSNLGYAVFIFVIDYRVFNFKFKGIFGFFLVGMMIVQLVYPVSTALDFVVVSNIDLVGNVLAIIIPVFFFYIGRKKTPVRLPSLAVAFGVIIYAIGSNIQNEGFLGPIATLIGAQIRIPIYLLSLILLIGGLLMFTYGVTRFANVFSSASQKPNEETAKA